MKMSYIIEESEPYAANEENSQVPHPPPKKRPLRNRH